MTVFFDQNSHVSKRRFVFCVPLMTLLFFFTVEKCNYLRSNLDAAYIQMVSILLQRVIIMYITVTGECEKSKCKITMTNHEASKT